MPGPKWTAASRANLATPNALLRIGHAVRRDLRQLPDLLLERHPRQQLINARLSRAAGIDRVLCVHAPLTIPAVQRVPAPGADTNVLALTGIDLLGIVSGA